MALTLQESLQNLSLQHRSALQWFVDHADSVQPWPGELPDGTLLVTKAKGIYKPKWSDYALSVRQTLGGPYPDKDPVVREDGSWRYEYYQEGDDPTARDAEYTNKGLMACWKDHVPVGVMRQVRGKPNVRYRVLGVALVASWDNGYFQLEGFSKDGLSKGVTPLGQLQDLEASAAQKADQEGSFDPSGVEDAREKAMQAMVARRGQPAFRNGLLSVYKDACVITGCKVPAALEAAHIVPYLGPKTNHLSNGLLLRADLHTLFDLGQIAIDENQKKVILAPYLQDSPYGKWHGKSILDPTTSEAVPSKAALRAHRLWAGLVIDT